MDLTEPRREQPRRTTGRRARNAVERTRAAGTRGRPADQLTALAEASLDIHSARPLEAVLRTVTEKARELIGAHQAVTNLVVDGRSEGAICHVSLSDKYAAWRGYDEKPDGSGIYRLVCESKRPMRMTQAELERHPAWRGFGQAAGKHPPLRGWLAAPLVGRDGRSLGLVQLSDKHRGEFTEGDEATLVQLAQLASVAVENARLLVAADAQRREAEVLAELTRAIGTTPGLDTVLQRVAEAARELCASDLAEIALRDDASGGMRIRVWTGSCSAAFRAHTVEPGKGAGGQVLVTGRPFRTDCYAEDPRLTRDYLPQALEEGIVTLLVVPIPGEAAIDGLLYVANRTARPFGEREERVLARLADHGAIAIRSAQLFQALRESEARHRTLVERSIQGICIHRGSVIGFANQAMAEILGYERPAELVGRDVRDLVAPHERARLEAYAEARLRERPSPSRLEVQALRKDGSPVWLDCLASVVMWGGERALLATFLDVTGRRRAQEQSEARRRSAEALAEVARFLSQSLDPDEVGRRIADSARALLATQHAALYRLDQASDDLVTLAFSGDAGPAVGRELRLPRGTGVTGFAVRERCPVVTRDLLADPRFTFTADVRAKIEQAPYRTVVAVPLLVQDRVIGVFSLGDGPGRMFGEDEVALLQAFADQAALALENSRLYAEASRERRLAEILARLAGDINASLNLDTVLQRIVEGARELCESDACAIGLRDSGSDTVKIRNRSGTRYQGYDSLRVEPGKGFSGRVLLTGQPVRSDDYLTDPRAASQYGAVVGEEGVAATLVVPIRIQNRVAGLLYVGRRSKRAFSDRDVAVLFRLADHAGIAIGNAQLFEEARAGQERLAGLSRRLVEVQEAERRRIARELHDEIGQALTGLKLSLGLSARHTVEPAGAGLDQTTTLVNDLIARVRELSLNLRPPMLDDLGLVPALLWHHERYTALTRVEVRFEHRDLDRRFPPEVETAAYRIVQEGLTNVARHAGVVEARVRIWSTRVALHLDIEDRGTGFEPEDTSRAHSSSGLAGMRERAALLGGELTVDSTRGGGTRVRAWLPVTEPRE